MKGKRGKPFILGALFLLLVLTFGLVSPVQAIEIIDDNHAVVEEGTVIDDDLSISGQTVEINGTVTGDVFAGGETVTINGEIEGNLFVGARDVVINGIVHGSVAAGGYTVTVGPDADLQRNLYISGYSLVAEQGSLVGRSVYLGGYQAILGGEVQRDVTAGGYAFVLDGMVGGDVNVGVEQIQGDGWSPTFFMDFVPDAPPIEPLQPGITITDNAEVAGELNQAVNNVYVPDPSITVEVPDPQNIGAGIVWRFLNGLRERTGEFISLVIIGAILLYFVRQPLQEVAAKMRAETLRSGLWGLLLAFLFPLAVILTFAVLAVIIFLLWVVTLGTLGGTAIQVGGLSMAVILAVAGLAAWFITKIIFGYLVGAALLERMAPDFFAGRWGDFAALVLGVLLYEIVRALPFLGQFVIAPIVILLGLGAIFLWLREKRQAMLPAAA